MVDKLWGVFGIAPSRCTVVGFDNFLYTAEGLTSFVVGPKKKIKNIGFLGSEKNTP